MRHSADQTLVEVSKHFQKICDHESVLLQKSVRDAICTLAVDVQKSLVVGTKFVDKSLTVIVGHWNVVRR